MLLWRVFVLTLRARTVFKIFEKNAGISLYWFAVQQQTNTSRGQKFGLCYLEFSAKFIVLVLSSKSNTKWPKNDWN